MRTSIIAAALTAILFGSAAVLAHTGTDQGDNWFDVMKQHHEETHGDDFDQHHQNMHGDDWRKHVEACHAYDGQGQSQSSLYGMMGYGMM